jgi:lysophospholipase L1-like esterase
MKTIKNIILVSLPAILILVLLLELFFRIVIPATDPPMGFFSEEERMYYFSNQREEGLITIGRFAQIKARWHINNEHWNYPIDYTPVNDRNLIAVIGDSYIEAFQVDADEKYPFLLRNRLDPDYEVYAFGKSGASLSHYLHVSRYVNRHFDPDILIFNMVHNDFEESIHELYPNRFCFMQVSADEDGSFIETVPRPNFAYPQYTAWKRIVYKSALFRYLDFNLKLRQIRRNIAGIDDRNFEANIAADKVIKNKNRIFEATDYLVRTIREENSDRRIIFVFDAPKGEIYTNTLNNSRVLWLNDMMKEICYTHDIEFLDLTPLMLEDYRVNGRKFTFELDGHWNEYGHEFVADVLYDYLRNSN